MLLKIPLLEDFDLEKIMRYKPFFFFSSSEPVRAVRLGGKDVTLHFSQQGQTLKIDADSELSQKDADFLKKRIDYCFGASEDLSRFYALCEGDKVLSRFSEAVYGNRLLSAFTDFEALISIVCSQNVTFRQYKKMVGNIIECYGNGRHFPSALDILKNPSLLKRCGVGYRDKYIISIAEYMKFRKSADIDSLHQVRGIGPYSLDIFRLFQTRDYSAFYVDVLITKIFRENYGAILESGSEVRSYAKKMFSGYAGLAEIYLQKFISDNR